MPSDGEVSSDHRSLHGTAMRNTRRPEMAMSAVRVLIGLRDTLVADAFAALLGDAGFGVTTCAGTPEHLVARAVAAAPDVIIVGADAVATDGGPSTLAALRARMPSAPVVVVLREGDEACASVLLQHAVNGVIPMAARSAEAIAILRQVLDGNVVYPGTLLARLSRPPEPELLSERQREVLEHVALGRSNDEIARRLFISPNTVKFHLREIYSRLGVRNRVEAARVASQTLLPTRRGGDEPSRRAASQPPM
jgi:DNA-binding NarL/FixJ family response regulator